MKRVVVMAALAFWTVVGYTQTEKQLKNINDTRKWLATTDFVYPYVDTDPAYPGGNESWAKYISSSPIIKDAIKKAKEQKIPAGKHSVVVNFKILPDGKLSNFKIRGRKAGYGLDEAAIKLIEGSGKWIPGHVEGLYRKSEINLPIHFMITY